MRTLFLIPFLLVNSVFASQQIVYLDPSLLTLDAGASFNLTVMYDVSDSDQTLSGIGISIHYDSSKLDFSYSDIKYIFENNLAGNPLIKDEDVDRSDEDESTDKVIVFVWADPFSNQWPSRSLPLRLLALQFTIKKKCTSNISTYINVTDTTLSAGYDFQSTNTSVNILNIKGDINFDGYSNIKDVLQLLEYLITHHY